MISGKTSPSMTAQSDLGSRLTQQSSASASVAGAGNGVGDKAEGGKVVFGEERKAELESA